MLTAPRLLACLLAFAALCGCEELDVASSESSSSESSASSDGPSPGVSGLAPSAASLASEEAFEPGDAEVGKALVKQFECNRCHDDTGHEPVEIEQHCTHCHTGIMGDTFLTAAPLDKRTKWKKHVASLLDAPSLGGAGRLDPRWIEGYLLDPFDVRPHMVSNMPRLRIDEQQAKDIATYLTERRGTAKEHGEPTAVLAGADVTRGQELLDQRSCGTCHDFGGAPLALRPPRPAHGEAAPPAVMMAPDLRFVRDRYRAAELVDWLENPSDWIESTLMPATQFSREEARDVAAYLLTVQLEPVSKPVFERLPVLEREVPFDEVMTEVFGQTCRHCHTDPDKARGDGGTGNTGGFGFPPRGLDVSSHRGLQSGLLGDDGERHSAFEPLSDGTPRLLASLIARHDEAAGRPNPEVRGMPLGLPPLSAEQIQLVETWISQGRKR